MRMRLFIFWINVVNLLLEEEFVEIIVAIRFQRNTDSNIWLAPKLIFTTAFKYKNAN